MEVYVLVPVRKTVVAKVVGTLMLVLAVVSLLAACLTSGITLPVALVCGIVWFVLMGNSKEFEYSYFDGEVRFAKVLNKNRRKSLGSYTMDDVIQIAPAGDRSTYTVTASASFTVVSFTFTCTVRPSASQTGINSACTAP